VSSHFEVIYSLFLKDDTPEEILAELRWHLGLSPEKPSNLILDYVTPQLAVQTETYLPGDEIAVLKHQQITSHRRAWGLYHRAFWKDDTLADLGRFAELLAAWADDDGYIGLWREADHEETPTVLISRSGQLVILEWPKDDV
jgi:hypothetical protein